MFYTVYKVTNILNGKYYIGKHQTKDLDDGYMGSGKLIRRAIRKHGLENFKKEILHVFDNEQDMNQREAELVTVSEETYNLCDGGKGGWSYVNRSRTSEENAEYGSIGGKSCVEKHLAAMKKNLYEHSIRNGKLLQQKIKDGLLLNGFKNKRHSEKTKQKMRKHKNAGEKNGSYGTCWITNETENKKIPKDALDKWLEMGYHKGRVTRSPTS